MEIKLKIKINLTENEKFKILEFFITSFFEIIINYLRISLSFNIFLSS